ncbi:hypothetical protein EZV62_005073 [Acer yangbiense]|uniref:UBP-type domain-containing protein n=1 Tax=Acer yangbiense TaxID=1000413 RepID=A0A5C7ILU2_9ROSI|nr:hypothetical protein EZV62_005073 [Acer yangbiense]
MSCSWSTTLVDEDDNLRSSPSIISGESSAPTEAFAFSSGNPRIEETRGVMHLFTNSQQHDGVSSSSPPNHNLPVGRKPLVCVLGVPNHMTYADFCQFCASFIQHILEMRIVRNDAVEDQYSILIRFDSQDSTDKFYQHFNGRQFNSLEVEVCHVLFTVDVQFTGYSGSLEHTQPSPASSTEQPSCPVCLDNSGSFESRKKKIRPRHKWNSHNYLQSFFSLLLYFKMDRFFLSMSGRRLSIFNGDLLPNPTVYRSVASALQDISFAVNQVCQYIHRRTSIHWKRTSTNGLLYSPGSQAYCDNDYASDLDDRRSTDPKHLVQKDELKSKSIVVEVGESNDYKVCRYCQQQPEKSICFVCQTSENLWMCVICGFMGCGRYKGGHAIIHWKETQHCYSLELETQRVWDYVGDNYVHRLIQSKTDGNLVELNSYCSHTKDNCGSCDCVDSGISETLLNSKVEAIVNEYNELLATQLENQKLYYETLLEEVKEEIKKETSEAVKKAIAQKLQKLQSKLDRCITEKKFLDDLNENLLKNQEIWKAKILDIEEREKKTLRLKDDKINELEKQLTDLMACLEIEKTVEQLSISNESKNDTDLPVVESCTSNGTKAGKGKK